MIIVCVGWKSIISIRQKKGKNMNIFKLGRGDFFGVIIPGAFLILNIMFIFPKFVNNLICKISTIDLTNNNAIFYVLLFVTSYIFGASFRLIRPDYNEKLSIIFWAPVCLLTGIFNLLRNKKGIVANVKLKFKEYCVSFPYIDYFYDDYLAKSPESLFDFYNEILNKEFKGDRNLMKGHNFINFCKCYVQKSSNDMFEELLFCEGLVRFISGMCIALILCIILSVFFLEDKIGLLLSVYIFLLILFIMKLRRIRIKEVLTVFVSFQITYNAKES